MLTRNLLRANRVRSPISVGTAINTDFSSYCNSRSNSVSTTNTNSVSPVSGRRGLSTRVTIETAKKMPKNYDEMPNDALLTMAAMGDQEAREERLIREIMAVDNVTWEDAQPMFEKMVQSNRRGLWLYTLPYKIGIAAALTAGLGSFPLIFEYHTVLWFNEFYVTTDVPEEKDLETFLEVGSFAWNWMEPPLGQISFFLLCMQFARAQLQNLDSKPYTGKVKERRAKRLVKEFPQYNKFIVESFSEGDSFSGSAINR